MIPVTTFPGRDVAVFGLGGIGLAVIFTGLGLVWVSAARLPVPTESVSTAPVMGPGGIPRYSITW